MRSFATSDSLYARAVRSIPLGSQTFSKSVLQVVKGASPLFFEHAEGGRVWDADGNAYLDLVLGLMPVILGHRDAAVDAAIRAQLERGISFSMPTRLEMEVAERLVHMVPSAEMVRFGKNGSDATAAAVRLARAWTGRDHLLMSGYHGWHDWSIGTTTRSLGVPRAVQELSTTFPFGDLEAVDLLLRRDPRRYAALILEPAGSQEPPPGFLEGLRERCDEHGIVLIFDEIVTGFRAALGGAQERYGVVPDLTTLGKGLANGMPLSAVVGRRDIMARMEDVFVSGTFGGEALSLAAALATLGRLEAEDVPATLERLALRWRQLMRASIDDAGLADRFAVTGPPWWPRVSPAAGEGDPELLVSLLRQEMHEQGVFMLGSVNVCLAHGEQGVEEELVDAWRGAFAAVAEGLSRPDPRAAVRGELVRPVFQVRTEVAP